MATYKCADRQCNVFEQHGDISLSRKMSSDFFGRNKRETQVIPMDVWHLMCRKGYQRHTYAVKKSGPVQRCALYIDQIKEQLIRLELWRPEALFTIQLRKRAKERYNQYLEKLRGNGNDEDAAKEDVAVVPGSTNKKGQEKPLSLENAVKMEHAEYALNHFVGDQKDYGFIRDTILPWIEGEVEAQRMTHLPPIEFLINEPQLGEISTDPETNYDRWIAQQDGTIYRSPTTKTSTTTKKKQQQKSPAPKTTSKAPIDTSRPPPKIKLDLKTPKKKKIEPKTPESDAEAAATLLKLGQATYTSPPRSPLVGKSKDKGKGKGKQRSTEIPDNGIPLWTPPPPITTKASQTSTPPSDIATATRPSSLPPTTTKKRKRASAPAAIDTARANNKKPKCSSSSPEAPNTNTVTMSPLKTLETETEEPGSAYTEIEEPPIKARGMIYAGGKKKRVRRDEA